ncbi:hypothetical protein [Fibrobacter sp.]|uniref:hypothetical protein n=1 Tax=Fibrobacter sp. TaxID=35828 RepID=UPI002633A475|nr:hypothetical protein [Fibrobacter sp.]MDD5942632.1 hypothetical protein [Fibrobacter sp.]
MTNVCDGRMIRFSPMSSVPNTLCPSAVIKGCGLGASQVAGWERRGSILDCHCEAEGRGNL